MMLVKVGKKYQIRIPTAIRDELALTRDTKLVGRQTGDSLELIPGVAPADGECYVTIRDRFQFTLPSQFRRAVGITETDMLALHVAEDRLIVGAKLISRPLAPLTKRVMNTKARPDHLPFIPSSGLVELAKQSKFRRKKHTRTVTATSSPSLQKNAGLYGTGNGRIDGKGSVPTMGTSPRGPSGREKK